MVPGTLALYKKVSKSLTPEPCKTQSRIPTLGRVWYGRQLPKPTEKATREVHAFSVSRFINRVSFPSPGTVEIHYVDYSGSKTKIILWPVVPKSWRTEASYPAVRKIDFNFNSSKIQP